MKITLDWLKEKNACVEAVKKFKETFGEEADYQSVLDALGKENRADWASWLIGQAGRTDSVLEIKGNLITETSIFFSGFIKVTGRIAAKFLISGTGIEAGEGIKAGTDYGIYAGLRLRISQKSRYALIIAKTQPKNIILGEYKQEGKGKP